MLSFYLNRRHELMNVERMWMKCCQTYDQEVTFLSCFVSDFLSFNIRVTDFCVSRTSLKKRTSQRKKEKKERCHKELKIIANWTRGIPQNGQRSGLFFRNFFPRSVIWTDVSSLQNTLHITFVYYPTETTVNNFFL